MSAYIKSDEKSLSLYVFFFKDSPYISIIHQHFHNNTHYLEILGVWCFR